MIDRSWEEGVGRLQRWHEAVGSPIRWDGIEAALARREERIGNHPRRKVIRFGSLYALKKHLLSLPRKQADLLRMHRGILQRTLSKLTMRVYSYRGSPPYRSVLTDLEIRLYKMQPEGRNAIGRPRRLLPLRFLRWISGWQLGQMMELDCLRAVLRDPEQERTACLLEGAQSGLAVLAELQGSVLAVGYPRVVVDDFNRLHNEVGPAVKWEDGEEDCYLHGVMVDRRVVLSPESFPAHRIIGERNLERRSIYIQRYGLERLLGSLDAEAIHRNAQGCLWRLRHARTRISAVEVECPSTGKRYFLRVPPNVRRVNEAIAWTFGLKASEYRPALES